MSLPLHRIHRTTRIAAFGALLMLGACSAPSSSSGAAHKTAGQTDDDDAIDTSDDDTVDSVDDVRAPTSTRKVDAGKTSTASTQGDGGTSVYDADAGDDDVPTADPGGSSDADPDPDTGAPAATGDCPSGAICHDEAPAKSTSAAGTHKVEKYTIARSSEHGGGTVYYPGDLGEFSGAVFCPPLTGVQAMYAAWGPFLASHGISLVTMDTRSTQDSVQSRGGQLAAMVKQFRGEATREGSPIKGKLNAQRIGTMGWSMGGGATWIAAAKDATLKSSISMAGHNATGGGAGNSRGTTVPSMQLAGETDTGILGGMGQSQGVYGIIPEATPKILLVVRGVGHMTWGGPTAATATGGEMTLAFQKTYLDGDTRWKKFLTKPANAAEWKSNITP